MTRRTRAASATVAPQLPRRKSMSPTLPLTGVLVASLLLCGIVGFWAMLATW